MTKETGMEAHPEIKMRIVQAVLDYCPMIRTIDISSSCDLYEAGMTSRASVSLVLALESAFNIEFPDSMLQRDVFQSIDAIASAVEHLQKRDQPARVEA